MKWKKVIADYFVFTRKERIGLLFLLFLILVIVLLPGLVNTKSSKGYTPADTSWISAVKRLETREVTSNDRRTINSGPDDDDNAHEYNRTASVPSPPGSLFYFDPNTIDEAGWKKLGLGVKTIRTIQNYLAKGGHFYKPGDLQKIYGIRQNEYERLAPYIKIENTSKDGNSPAYAKKENEPKRFSYNSIDINTADTSAFIALPGIGSKLAARIVAFREKLGGFYSIEQVREIYGLQDSVFQKIRQYLALEEIAVKKININTATKDEMKTHPYIKWNLANIIVEYRNQHGNFSSLSDLKKISAVTDSVYAKIVSYLIL
ncbi:MAG: helix-hairpin-helix domain-containing protein [Bacteroidota bacterium]|nr:helix-hairpin-helix domain-containing protein [Bacteroidota bacterium]